MRVIFVIKSLIIFLLMVGLCYGISTKQIYPSNRNMAEDLSIRKDGRACTEPHKILGHLFERGQEMPRKGYKQSPEHKQKLSKIRKGKSAWNKGVKRSKAAIEKQRKSMIGKLVKDLKGQRFGRLVVLKEAGRSQDKRVLWQCKCDCGKKRIIRGHDLIEGKTKSCGCLMGVPGISRRSHSYDEWRLAVFERDNFTCTSCGKIGGRLHAHHIRSYDEYPELRLDVNNGSTKCQSCHMKLQPKHKKRRKVN